MFDNDPIQDQHRRHLSSMRAWLEGKGWYRAAEALELVRNLEIGTRKDKVTPKFDHQLSVARLVMTLSPHLSFPEETMCACFLHDLLEDHGDMYTVAMLDTRFGGTVAQAVWKLSKKSVGFQKTYETYFEQMATCPIASIVKLADRAHNLQTMPGVFTTEKQHAYLEEVETWFLPLCKTARRSYPRQFGAYENLKILLRCQCELITAILAAQEQSPQHS